MALAESVERLVADFEEKPLPELTPRRLELPGLPVMAYVQTQSGYEVDFLAESLLGERQLVQVSADLSDPQTRHREMRALEEAMAETGLARATLVTMREEGSEALGKGIVQIVPAWRWLLDPEAFGRGAGSFVGPAL